MKEKVATLEKQLVEEQRKTEDLQFSLDEATFCSDELSVSIKDIVFKFVAQKPLYFVCFSLTH